MGKKPRHVKSNRKRQKLSTTQLEDLPVEVLLTVLAFLELPDLNRVGQVSKRLNSIRLVQSCRQKVILGNNTCPEKTTVSVKVVEKILDRGCKTLCLKRCRLTGEPHLHSKADEKSGSSQLINLDIYQCEFPNGCFEKLLSSSHSLKKLSLTDNNINLLDYGVLRTFYSQNSQTLQTLNLAFTAVLDCYHIKLIVKNCIGLKEVDLSDCRISDYCIHLLVNGLTKNIEKVGLACSNSVTDASIGILVSRCNKIKSLNLAFNYITDNSLTSIKENLEYTLEELDVSGCRNIPHIKLLEMRSMQKLKVLNYFNPRDCNYENEVVLLSYPKIIDNDYEDLKKNLPQLTNNNPWEKWKAWHVGASLYFFERRKHLWEIRGRPGSNWV